jgi:hypothetical protein
MSVDAINMSLMARCIPPFTKKACFPSATLIISTLRIFKEQQLKKLQTLIAPLQATEAAPQSLKADPKVCSIYTANK